jgi:glyoxylase-like metal-dependent hydrolase (beta-lactamase superfamily II)
VRAGALMPVLTPGVPTALSPLVRRITAPNPSPMTGPGTNTYLVGIDEVAVIDPGPDDPGHVEAIIGAAMADRIRWVLLTHGHPDHAPAAARLAARTGARICAFGGRHGPPAVDRRLGEGAVLDGTEFRLEALHTPGHAPDHLCFLLGEERILFSGDVVLGGMYSVVSPHRGGDMAAYVATLRRLRSLRLARIAPGHGDVIEEPGRVIDDYLEHRADRERQILEVLTRGPARIGDIVAALYADVPAALHEAAGWQVHAHLRWLRSQGRVRGRDARSRWSAA